MVAAPRPRAVLVMARAPGHGGVSEALEPLLGAKRSTAVSRELILRTVRWAAEVAPGAVSVAFAPDGAGAEMDDLFGASVHVFAQHGDSASQALVEASARLFAEPGEGPLLIAWPDLPRWRADHAAGALADLREGCDVSVGPVFDGGFYLLGLARALPALLEAPDADWLGPNAMASAFSAAHEAGLEVGMLRAERGLRHPGDMRAVLADPLTDPRLRALLE